MTLFLVHYLKMKDVPKISIKHLFWVIYFFDSKNLIKKIKLKKKKKKN
jgi:hypothetical protein